MNVHAICVVYFLVFVSCDGSKVRKKTAEVEGEVLIGALFSVHDQPAHKTAFARQCGDIREQYGIQRVEATFQAIDAINRNPLLLPNVTLGVEIRDSCWYAPVALEQSIEFIRDALSFDSEAYVPKKSAETNDSCTSQRRQSKERNLVGVLGPGSSAVAIQVQNLLQLFNIPQVGYSSTSRDLSDKSRFSYFLRVVPSDYYQAQVMVDIVKQFNWTYVSVVNTDGNYGQSGMQAFRELAEENNICIAKEDSVLSNAEEEAYDEVLQNLLEDTNARVIVCFCEGVTVRELLKAQRRANISDFFLFVGSDGWADRMDVVEDYEREIEGSISIRINAPYVTEFDDYYFGLMPDTNLRNPWFREFWQSRFSCTFNGVTKNGGKSAKKKCTGKEDLRSGYKQDSKLAFVIKAVYALAWGLHRMQQSVCGVNYHGLCPEMTPFNGSLYKEHLLSTGFTYNNEVVQFDSKGDPPGRYDIMSFRKVSEVGYDYVQIGTWDNGTLHLTSPPSREVESVCSQPCAKGYAKNYRGSNERCCWVCMECDPNEILLDETTCFTCQLGTWPNENLTACDDVEVEYIQWSDRDAIASVSLAVFGLIVTLVVMVVFIKHNDTPVVKASTRELRVLPGLSFAMIYAALLTKTNRIARILAGSKRIMTKKSRCMSASAQVVIAFCLIMIEGGIIFALFILEPADWEYRYPTVSRKQLVCNTTLLGIMAPLGFAFFLIAMCTVYAIKTRNLPENFNEAKFIGFAMYTTCVIWVAFVPIYFGSHAKVITLCICVSLSALVTLVFLFFPKVYIIVLHPERNNRSFFKTATSVRCHIGGRSSYPVQSKISNYSVSEYSTESQFHSTTEPLIQRNIPPGLRTSSVFPAKNGSVKAPSSSSTHLKPYAVGGVLKRDAAVMEGQDQVKKQVKMLRKAYGSQVDISGSCESHRNVDCQTDDNLLETLLPTLRKRRDDSHALRRQDRVDSLHSDLSDKQLLNSSDDRKMLDDCSDSKTVLNVPYQNEYKTIVIRLQEDAVCETNGRVYYLEPEQTVEKDPMEIVSEFKKRGLSINVDESTMMYI